VKEYNVAEKAFGTTIDGEIGRKEVEAREKGG